MVLQQLGDVKVPPGSSLYNGGLSNTSPSVYHNGGSSYLHAPGNILFNGLNLGLQPLAFNSLRPPGGALLGGSAGDMQLQAGQDKLGSSAEDPALQYASYGGEVKLEGVHPMAAAHNGGSSSNSSVLAFSSSGALQLGGYSLVQVPGGVSDGDGSLLNSDVGLPPLQLSSSSPSSAIPQGGFGGGTDADTLQINDITVMYEPNPELHIQPFTVKSMVLSDSSFVVTFDLLT